MVRSRLFARRCASLAAALAVVVMVLACGETTHGTGEPPAPTPTASEPDAAVPPGAPFTLARTIPMPHVEGRIDHLTIDVAGQRLFVAALGNNTVEVIDLKAGHDVHSITGLHEPQGIVFIPDTNQIVVANGESGAADVFDATSFDRVRSVALGDDADNVRYEAATKTLYVGYGSGAIGAINAATGERLPDTKLSGHPESLALEASGARIYVNVPDTSEIAVVDRATHALEATWRMERARANFPLALDEANHRLFVGCREPARVVVVDTTSGKSVTDFAIGGDTDDLFYDAARKRLYVSCGAGRVDAFEQQSADSYAPIGSVPTAAGGRTSLYVADLGRLFVAVPHRGSQQAEIRVYDVASSALPGR
jgi:hypothetical protein